MKKWKFQKIDKFKNSNLITLTGSGWIFYTLSIPLLHKQPFKFIRNVKNVAITIKTISFIGKNVNM